MLVLICYAQAQGEEPKEFLYLFSKFQVVAPDEATESGLNHVEFADHPTRLYMLVFDGIRAKLDQVRANAASTRQRRKGR